MRPLQRPGYSKSSSYFQRSGRWIFTDDAVLSDLLRSRKPVLERNSDKLRIIRRADCDGVSVKARNGALEVEIPSASAEALSTSNSKEGAY